MYAVQGKVKLSHIVGLGKGREWEGLGIYVASRTAGDYSGMELCLLNT